ncbi:sigma factor-like helix-turn-helix DNA-binding protein [Modestobacter sp. SYSU DS0511]
MGGQDGFDQFVADHRRDLLGSALLLTGDRLDAEELVQAALVRTRRVWPPADPLGTARRALVAGATRRGSWRPAGGEVAAELPDPAGAVDDELARALRELPRRARAAVVLRHHEGLDEASVAALLDCPVPAAAAEVARGVERLRPAVRPDPYRPAHPVPDEQRLQDALARLAAAPGRWRLDAPQAVADVGSRRSGRRRRALGGAALTALVLTGAVVTLDRPAPVLRTPPGAPAAAEPPAAAAPPAEPLPTAPVLTSPARGSLAGDPAFLAAAQQADWGPLEAPPVVDRSVVFAGDTPAGRAVLVVGTVTEDFRGVWLTGPVGAPPAQLTPHVPRGLGEGRPLTLLLGGPGPASLIVVAGREDVVEVSDRLLVGARGTVGRRYTPVETVDGAAVVPARTTEDGPSISVRVTREGRVVLRSAVAWPGDRPGRTVPLPELTTLRPTAGPADDRVVAAALTGVAVPLGVEPAELQPELLWNGELPLSTGPGSVVVVLARSPGGALVVTTWAGGGGGAVTCGTQTPAGSTDPASLTIARVCDVEPPGLRWSDGARWLVVTAPAAGTVAEVLDDRERVLTSLPLTGGGAVTELPEGARSVRVLDGTGEPIAQTPVAASPTQPFGDFGSGLQR